MCNLLTEVYGPLAGPGPQVERISRLSDEFCKLQSPVKHHLRHLIFHIFAVELNLNRRKVRRQFHVRANHLG